MIRQTWHRLTKALRPRRPVRRAHLGIEALEGREVPAGNVLATLANGTLTITGVDDLSAAGLMNNWNNQSIVIKGTGASQFEVSGMNNTQINASNMPALFSNVTNIKVDMKLGNDEVVVNSAKLPGALTVIGGGGKDSLTIGSTVGNQSFGSVSFTGGEGDDSFTIGKSIHTIAGALSLNMGDGANNVTIGVMNTDELTTGSLAITNGVGYDKTTIVGNKLIVNGAFSLSNGVGDSLTSVNVATLTLGGALTVTNGTGNDKFTMGDQMNMSITGKGAKFSNGDGYSKIYLEAAGKLTGNLEITNGDGHDETKLRGLEVTGNVTIKNGGGGSLLGLIDGNNKIDGSLAVTGGVGDDDVEAKTLIVGGSVMINGGSGDLDVNLGTGNGTQIGGTLTVSSASGGHSVNIGASFTSSSMKSATFNLAGDYGDVFITSTTVTGNVSYIGGEGQDRFEAEKLTLNGSLTANHGVGNSFTELTDSSVTGGVTVSALDGEDEFWITGSTAAVGGAVNVNLGDGPTKVRIGATTSTTIGGALSVTSKSDDDDIGIGGTGNLKGVTLSTGSGGNFIDFGGFLKITGNLSVTTGSGSDTVLADQQLEVTGNATFKLGDGGSYIFFNPGVALWKIGGNFTATAAVGTDTFIFQDLTVGGTTTVNTGVGDDYIRIDDSTFKGNATFDTGAGHDRIEIEQQNTGKKSSFAKTTVFNLGSGDDSLTIGRVFDGEDFGEFLGGVSVNVGTGIDVATYKPVASGGFRNNIFATLPAPAGAELVF